MKAKIKKELDVDEFELECLRRIASKDTEGGSATVIEAIVTRILSEMLLADSTSCATFRAHMSVWWRVLGTCIESSVNLVRRDEAFVLFRYITVCMAAVKAGIDEAVLRSNFVVYSKETISVYSGFNLAYTSIVRCVSESVFSLENPLLVCEVVLGLESVVPMDNKGICNVYKRVRQVDVGLSVVEDVSMASFDEANVQMDDMTKSFKQFWAVMDISRRLDSEILSETRAWGKFSQAATATLSILLEQCGENLEAFGPCAKEPLVYESKLSVFPVQLTSCSFRRRAVWNILFTSWYVSQNGTNALITAGARNLVQSVLKSLPKKISNFATILSEMETHWINWKSAKEVCAPFEVRTRLERGLIDSWSPPELDGQIPQQTPLFQPTELVKSQTDSEPTVSQPQRLEEYRKYVAEAILCDISDDAERERLAATDEGLEEAMNQNKVLLWQFKRMRFNTENAIDDNQMHVDAV